MRSHVAPNTTATFVPSVLTSVVFVLNRVEYMLVSTRTASDAKKHVKHVQPRATNMQRNVTRNKTLIL
jgi:hypothetical protein